ncbi:MAG: hypothetical protein WCE44_07915 [Candidatus Velthaea sp.]
MTQRFLTVAAAVAIMTAFGFPIGAQAASTGTVTVNITAPVLATITVSNGTISCDTTSVISLLAPCTSSATISGSVRSSRNTATSLTITGVAISNSSSTNSVSPSAFAMTCVDSSTGAQHGALTVASATALSTSTVPCASWAANAQGNILSISETLSFTVNSYLVPADTYTASNWTVTLSAS